VGTGLAVSIRALEEHAARLNLAAQVDPARVPLLWIILGSVSMVIHRVLTWRIALQARIAHWELCVPSIRAVPGMSVLRRALAGVLTAGLRSNF
jgi:hypothetical protein